MFPPKKYFQIQPYETRNGQLANVAIIDQHKGVSYLAYCVELEESASHIVLGERPQALLILPFAELNILTFQGEPVTTPANWEALVIRPLEFQDPFVGSIEESLVA